MTSVNGRFVTKGEEEQPPGHLQCSTSLGCDYRNTDTYVANNWLNQTRSHTTSCVNLGKSP